MELSFYTLCWFYFLYSFAGWCVEVCAAALKRKKFINRGFVNGPLCPIYGTGAVLFAVFLPELKENLFFLFLGGAILASVVEFLTGAILEKMFHRKWWDYSKLKFSFEGYVCLQYSILWGILAVLLVYFVNPIVAAIAEMLPYLPGVIVLWMLTILLVLDTIGSALAILGMHRRMEQISQLTEGIGHISRILENAITRRITWRMDQAFPTLNLEKLTRQKKEKARRAVFAEGCSFYKLLALFFIGALLGDLVETVFCRITMGYWMSRSSVVYGPFSIVWGLGCMFLTAVLYRIKDKSDSYIFVTGTLLGGAYEYICSVFTELVFGTVFWDYSGFRFNLGGRINLLYCFFWGVAAVVWMRLVYPFLSRMIERLPIKLGKILCNAIMLFMLFNCLISSLALARYSERNAVSQMQEQEERSQLDEFLDEYFDDERMEKVYPKAKILK